MSTATLAEPAAGTSTRPAVSVLAAVVSVQLGAALATHLFPAWGPLGTVTVRLAAAAVVLLLIARPRPHRVPRRHLLPVAAFGVVLGAMNLSFYAALDRIPLGIAVTVEFAGPLAVAVLGSRRPRDLLWALLGAAGVVLLTGGGRALLDGGLDPLGVGFALLAAVGWAGYILLSQRVGALLPQLDGLALALLVAVAVIGPWGIARTGTALLRPGLLLLGIGVGVLSSALPWALELGALRRLTAGTFGVLMSLEPAAAALVGLVLLRQRLTPLQLIAVALTCLASAGAAVGRRSPAPTDG